ncbi:MAG: tetratricopeptide repeat protein [Planctomycetes bacterium]|nr:tetratricopeptide repeat protein [Planctomycetota bacterium]
MRRPLFLAFAAVTLFTSAPAAPTIGRESLQELLTRLRGYRDSIVDNMRGDVDRLIAAMDAAAIPRDLEALESARKALVALGPECALLLVDRIDPGAQGTDADKLRAQYVMLTLMDLKTRAATTRLIEIAQTGSVDGRANAITALGLAPDADRAGPVLVGIYRSNHGELRAVSLLALARLGGEANDKILDEGLVDARPEVVDAVLEALAASKKSSMAPRVLRILASPVEAVRHLDPLLNYYRAVPEAVDRVSVLGWIKVAGEISATVAQRQKVFDFLPTVADRMDPEARRELRKLSESQTREIAEGALVVLVVAGDRNARKELLAPYDEAVNRNKDWPNAYTARADVLYRINDYKEALNDYKKAIQIGADDLRSQQVNAHIGLARCYAMTKRINDAGTTLERAPLTAKQLVALKSDPAFAGLIDHPKYKNLFNGR